MKRPRLIAFCVFSMSMLMLSVAGSGFVLSQPSEEIRQAFFQDMQKSGDEIRQLSESIMPLFADMAKNMQPKVMAAITERMKDTSTPPTEEEMIKLGQDIAVDGFIEMRKPLNEKATEFLSEEGRQKMHLRAFQAKMGLMERLEATDNPDAIEMAMQFHFTQLICGYPDFLELSPEQRELVTQQQKETQIELQMLQLQVARRRQAEAMQKAETDEERERISRTLESNSDDVIKAFAPEMKKLLIKGHEDFMRVLTDAQKAKIKTVMADLPDYIMNMLADMDKGGDMSNVLNSWVPGMGAPGVNPNREAPRERTNTGGGRAFPN
jgi:cytochrome c556